MESKKEISPAKLMWKMTRPHTLTATFAPVILGTVIALYDAKIDWLLFIAMMLACLALQIATNLFNEYYDFKRGLDTADSVGIGGGIVRHGLKPQNVLTVAILLYVLAAFIGVYICMNSSWWLMVIGLFGMAIGYLYTGGPLPIAYTPFGELFSGLLMGTGFVLIALFIQTNTLTVQSVLISIPIGMLVGAINMSNNIRDIEEDINGGRKTLAILLGREKGIIALAIAFAVSYLWIVVLVAMGYVSPWVLVVFLTAKKPISAIQGFKKGATEPQYMRVAMKSTAMTNTVFGFLLSAGLLIGYFLK
ncbi:1,4-dihydroxy-2-naphthoate octaprenyltransferase [Bacillus thuringiensis serovar brasilensis]|uniref:1,4-dihydroxy-2-naphthoate polyprenyltransferase n=1 Tax=Bacillus cereus group TaxID=86661 RepID=UPI000A3B372A|nr:1,4-dihydroxy-2-naphthoate polyprenyltransferase [Bacillus thuringiensis]MCU5031412.1 1,4-dihydroxy-2-naphthoate polyprenyltransferase [Bacillus cereus]MRA74150.1 1,4-dihydroxy-2-naphthoate polyprenyltransferase [Bacillus thuringiensis]MRA92740.1 1,4-dihydroxy-2-naphthoate polyprenyltransferase [Bacillus thuringiensis]MRC55314.1 1,4-dihydroxy-2-naphthoate polyprenyltransferase [Bacillus thuringiensis]OTX35202.1 1,4-dihydroxy-2-naphthoate octaprenyltransferase [Bacillus thuringiensis serovar